MLIRHYSGDDETSALVELEFEEITRIIAFEEEFAKTDGRNRHRLFISVSLGIFAQWNGIGLFSYYLVPILESIGITSVSN
ncbi:MFS sugar transporter [Penicillium cf. viridicatum]|uniref:MFS sugar transporter n=1 Tax=Penicillium cf. viridicatum TaxID=2972119 RepID=A0A9W9JEX2_9EURO|nr:MFS sugar transporter [Penicillium cf. viridicatum]